MSIQQHKQKPPLSKSLINIQDQYFSNIMDARLRNNPRKSGTPLVEQRKLEYCRSFTQGHGKTVFRYFSLESFSLLVCLTLSLLILPLVLPPLPPPPFMLLLLPICILGLLMVLAFMPSNGRNATYTYA